MNTQKKRTQATRPTHMGRIVLFVEGQTERAYFTAVKERAKGSRYNDIQIKGGSKGRTTGNAQTVLNEANAFFEKDHNAPKLRNYTKYLVFDCDAPEDIQRVIVDMRSKGYELLYTNECFEAWLLMHLEEVSGDNKSRLEERLSDLLKIQYKKGNEAVIKKLLGQGSIPEAIKRAKVWRQRHDERGYDLCRNIKDMTPDTSVHILMQELFPEE